MGVIFSLKVQSVVDVITNSSSELFVGTAVSKREMTKLIKSVYPNFRNEYERVKSINDLTISELETYISYHCSPHMWPATKSMYPILPGFTFEELYEAEDGGKPAWNGEIQYELKNNIKRPRYRYDNRFVTRKNFQEIKRRLDPRCEMFFLFSLDENPDWDYQEKLEVFMNRHHLG